MLGEAKGAHTWPTWRREEGPRQLAVSGELFDLSDDVDESTDRWRDPVEAEHSGDKDRVKKKNMTSQICSSLVLTFYITRNKTAPWLVKTPTARSLCHYFDYVCIFYAK